MTNRSGLITLAWADGEYAFRLGWGEIERVQEACDAGPLVVLDRLRRGAWRLSDIDAVVMWGLVGAGRELASARALVDAWVRRRPPTENVLPAIAILSAGVLGPPDEPVEDFAGKPAAASPDPSRSPAEKSGLPPSTDSAQPADSALPK